MPQPQNSQAPRPKIRKKQQFFSQNPPILSKERFFVVVVKRLKALPLHTTISNKTFKVTNCDLKN